MPGPFGVTPTGFVPMTLQDCLAQVESDLQAEFGASIDLSPKSNFGILAGIIAERMADLWSDAADVYASFTIDGAVGASLDYLEGLRGITRLQPTFSKVLATLTGNNGTLVPSGSVVAVNPTGIQFVTQADATLATAAAWATGQTESAGNVRSANGNIYLCRVGGVTLGSGTGPSGTGAGINDNGVIWDFMGSGLAYTTVECNGITTGPLVAAAETLIVIVTQGIAGWSGVSNALDATLGTNLELDAAYRARGEQEIRSGGNADLEAIRSTILALGTTTTPPVVACTVFENTGDVTDGSGRAPHSVECLVTGGADADVAKAIFDSVAAGIATDGLGPGAKSVTVTDSQGQTHVINWSVPANVLIYVRITVTADPNSFPADGQAEVQAAIDNWGNNLPAGFDVTLGGVSAQAFKIPGVFDVPPASLLLSTDGITYTSANIPITARQQAKFDTSRIAVTVNLTQP